MIPAVRIHLHGIKTSLASRMAYRADFFMSIAIMLIVELLTPLVTYLVYQNGASFPGWTLYEAMLIQGIFLLARGIAFPFFFGMVWNTIERVREGTFDLLLIKPKSVLFLAIVTGFDSEDLGKLLGGIALFSLFVSQIPTPGIWEWVQFLALFSISLVVLFGFALILAALGIVWIGNFRVYDIFFSIANFGMYPATIFPKVLQTLITIFLPIAVLGYLPAAALLGRPAAGTLWTVGASIIFTLLCFWFWNRMLKKYTSVGG